MGKHQWLFAGERYSISKNPNGLSQNFVSISGKYNKPTKKAYTYETEPPVWI